MEWALAWPNAFKRLLVHYETDAEAHLAVILPTRVIDCFRTRGAANA